MCTKVCEISTCLLWLWLRLQSAHVLRMEERQAATLRSVATCSNINYVLILNLQSLAM